MYHVYVCMVNYECCFNTVVCMSVVVCYHNKCLSGFQQLFLLRHPGRTHVMSLGFGKAQIVSSWSGARGNGRRMGGVARRVMKTMLREVGPWGNCTG